MQTREDNVYKTLSTVPGTWLRIPFMLVAFTISSCSLLPSFWNLTIIREHFIEHAESIKVSVHGRDSFHCCRRTVRYSRLAPITACCLDKELFPPPTLTPPVSHDPSAQFQHVGKAAIDTTKPNAGWPMS